MIFGYGFLAVCIIAYSIMVRKIQITKEKGLFFFLVLMISAFIFIGNSGEGTTEYAIGMDLCALVAIVYIPEERQYVNAFKLLYVFSIAFSIYSILMFISPNIYQNMVRPIISASSVEYNAALIRDGYGVALGANVAYIDYMVAVGIVFSISCILNQYRFIRSRVMQFGGMIISLMGMLCVNRKGELLGVIIAVFVLYRVQMKKSDRKAKKRMRRIAFVSLAAAAVAIAYLALHGYLVRYYLFFNKISRNLSHDRVDISSGRLYIWRYALELFRENPILGIGWEQFSADIPAYNIDTVKVHNNFIQLLCETGIIGFLLIAIPMLALLVLTYRDTNRYFSGCT